MDKRKTVIGGIAGVAILGLLGVWALGRPQSESPTQTAIPTPTPENRTAVLPVIESKKIEPRAAQELIDSKENDPNFIVMDVRTAEEYAGGHVKGAQNLVDYYAPDVRERLGALDHSKTYLVYCRTGHRSGEVVEMMRSLGFDTVYDLSGGITAWTQALLPVE